MNRRSFLATLAAVPLAGVSAVKAAPGTWASIVRSTTPWPTERIHGLTALVNDGTQAPTYGGISRDTGLPAFYRTHHARVNQLHADIQAMTRR